MTPEELEAIRVRREMVSTSCGACGAPATHYRLPSQQLPGQGYYIIAQCEEHIGPRGAPLLPGTTQAWADIAALLAEVERLRSLVPRLEWREGTGFVSARAGVFVAIVSAKGWELRSYLPYCTGVGDLVDRGPETGPAGKSAAEAAYRRACGFPTAPPCAG